MAKLMCVVVGGTGRAFPVDIDIDQAVVGDLKNEIKKQNSSKLSTVDAPDLQLFLAKTGDKWLRDDIAVEMMLRSRIDTSPYMEMRSTSKLSNPTLFGSNVSLGEGVIHVLVVVPECEEQGQVESASGLFSMLREDRERRERFQREVQESLAFLAHKNSRSYTDGELGRATRQRLERYRLMSEVEPEDGEAFWSVRDQEQADGITVETDFDTFITPFFGNILRTCGLVFVNSTRYPWLFRQRADFNPDGFATMYRSRLVPSNLRVDLAVE